MGITRNGMGANDGGCALIDDGFPIVAIAEERITRKKYDSGFINSLNYCLENAHCLIGDIDCFVFSNCCDEPLDINFIKDILQKGNLYIPENKIIINKSHHLSHAASVFYPSQFDRSLILIVDNEGNILKKTSDNYWENSLERTSLYVGEGTKIRFLERHNDEPGDLGIGGAYNYFTHWLGFNSYKDAGKTMGLASYGENFFKGLKLFSKGRCCLENTNKDKLGSVRRFFIKKAGIDIGESGKSTKKPNKTQEDVAFFVQKEVERILVEIVKNAVKKYKIKNLCISGGVALNCVANYEIFKKTGIEKIFIQPASGDDGQCLGNAYLGYFIKKKSGKRKEVSSFYLGKRYSDVDIKRVIDNYSDKIEYTESKTLYKTVAKLIASGKIIGWFQGGSEFGPRALGNRSIFADPRDYKMKSHINKKVKFRESFRPYAPVILEKYLNQYFALDFPSPFMLFAPSVYPNKVSLIPAVTHVDGTARVQTVNKEQNSRLCSLIGEFEKITGIPILLNTSFNVNGEPIVESPEDAIKCFIGTNIDVLVIGNYIINKKAYIDSEGYY